MRYILGGLIIVLFMAGCTTLAIRTQTLQELENRLNSIEQLLLLHDHILQKHHKWIKKRIEKGVPM